MTTTSVLHKTVDTVTSAATDAVNYWLSGQTRLTATAVTPSRSTLPAADRPPIASRGVPLHTALQQEGYGCYTDRQITLHKRRARVWARLPYAVGALDGIAMEIATISWLYDSFSNHMNSGLLLTSLALITLGWPALTLFMWWQFHRTTTHWTLYDLDLDTMCYGDGPSGPFYQCLPRTFQDQVKEIQMTMPGVWFKVDCMFVNKAPWDPILWVCARHQPDPPAANWVEAVARWFRGVYGPQRRWYRKVAIEIWD